jgi:hypothetical protein
MPSRENDARPVTLVDIPLVKRLSDKGIILDSELGLTGDTPGTNTTLLSSLLLPQRGLHTFVAWADKQRVIGQFRIKPDNHNAHIIFIAPQLDEDVANTAWLHVLDAMAREAGKHGAHCLVAELEEQGSLFETLRTANFAVYARQRIWRRQTGDYQFDMDSVELTTATDEDASGVYSLLVTTVPSLIQQVCAPLGELQGLVYRKDDRVEGYFVMSEGKQGIYLIPYLHPDIIGSAAAVLESVIRQAHRAVKVPVYVCVRRYQDWLESALLDLGFETFSQQAVMVRHITAGIRHAEFEPLRQTAEAVRSPMPPPTR